MNIDFTKQIIESKEKEILNKPFPCLEGYALFTKTKEGQIVRMTFLNQETVKAYLNNLGYDWGNEIKDEFRNFDSEKRLLTVLPELENAETVAADPQWDPDKTPKETVTKHESDRTIEDLPHLAVELREVDHPLHWDESNYDTKAEESEAKKPDFLKKKDDKKNGKKDDKKNGKKDDKKNGKKGDEEEKDKNGKKLPPWLNKKGSKSKDYSKLWEKVNAKHANFKEGDNVKNVNPECKHFESKGVVNGLKKLPEDEGYTVGYTCTNSGKNWKEGDKLRKTPDQLVKY